MKARSDSPGLWIWLTGAIFLLPATLETGSSARAMFQDLPRPNPVETAAVSTATANLQYKGVAIPGARITIDPEASTDPDAVYQWTQTEGPSVDLGAASGPKLQFTVPDDARKLGFSLTIRDNLGSRRAAVTIPIRTSGASPSSPSPSSTGPRADAGDDQIGLVGRKITLNGGGSTPVGRVAYRWLVLGGSKVEGLKQDGGYLTFTPDQPGIYRFGLIVASVESGQPRMSDVDEVTVTVGEYPWATVAGVGSPVPTAAIDQMLQGPGGPSGRETLEQAATIFEAIASRAALYKNFGELSSELMRRLDGIIPNDPSWRQFWSQAVFAPLSQHLAVELLASGIDLRSPQGQQQALTANHQERLQKIFTLYAREFRARAQKR